MKKKLLAFALSLLTAVSTVGVSAASFDDINAENIYYNAIQTLSGLNILTGDDSNADGIMSFRPYDNISRAEMTAVLFRMRGEFDPAQPASSQFYDVPASHWASGYISKAAAENLVSGYGNGLFGPDDNIMYQDVVKMVMVTLGYSKFAENNGGYPSGYEAAAASCGVLNNVVGGGYDIASSRGQVAQIVANAISAPLMDSAASDASEYVIYDGGKYPLKTCMTEYLKSAAQPAAPQPVTDIEPKVLKIREWYNLTNSDPASAAAAGLSKEVTSMNYKGANYSVEKYCSGSDLYFAFVYNGTIENRLYFWNNTLFRWIDESGVTHDNDFANPEFLAWQTGMIPGSASPAAPSVPAVPTAAPVIPTAAPIPTATPAPIPSSPYKIETLDTVNGGILRDYIDYISEYNYSTIFHNGNVLYYIDKNGDIISIDLLTRDKRVIMNIANISFEHEGIVYKMNDSLYVDSFYYDQSLKTLVIGAVFESSKVFNNIEEMSAMVSVPGCDLLDAKYSNNIVGTTLNGDLIHSTSRSGDNTSLLMVPNYDKEELAYFEGITDFCEQNGGLYLGTNRGLYFYDYKSFKETAYPYGFYSSAIANGSYYVAGNNKEYDGTVIEQFDLSTGVSLSVITANDMQINDNTPFDWDNVHYKMFPVSNGDIVFYDTKYEKLRVITKSY